MKKFTLLSLLLFTVSFAFSQTIVSTSQENKKGLLEEYTGIHCGYCPQGHTIADNIKAANPNTFHIINIHVGTFAVPGNGEPDFRTDFGSAIDNQAGVTGYPMGSINRHVFSGSNTAMSRASWAGAFNQIKTQTAYVNVAVESEINIATRELTVHVEAYYTGASPENTNLLNVALLQNNTLGPQSGGGAGNNYNHSHRLVHMLTGQWGESITTTSQGTFVDRTYTYTVPTSYRGVWTDMSNLEVIAFITETQQEVANVDGVNVTTTGTLLASDAAITLIDTPKGNCDLDVAPKLSLYNAGQNPLTSLSIEYSVNGGTAQTHNWTGNVASLHVAEVTLPVQNISLITNNTISATIMSSDGNASNDNFSVTFTKQEFLSETFEDIHVFIDTDNWGYELTWEVKNSSNVTVASGGGNGNNGSAGSYGNNITATEVYNLPTDCYKLIVNDSYGDGGNAVIVRTTNNQTDVVSITGGYGFGDDVSFKTSSTAAIDESLLNKVSMYPNPASDAVTFMQAKDLEVTIFDVLGKQVYKNTLLSNSQEVNLSQLNQGVYLVNITNGVSKTMKKLIIK